MKLMLVVITTALLVFAPSALTAPVSKEEEAEAMLQVIQTILASADNSVRESQAVTTTQSSETTVPASTASSPTQHPLLVNCVKYARYKECYYCTKAASKPALVCYPGLAGSTWDPVNHS